MRLELEQVSWSVAGKAIVQNVSLSVPTGAFVGLLGPNGSGKSSLLKTIYRVHKPDAGKIELAGSDVWRMKIKELAQKNAVVAQENSAEFDFRVLDLVMMGRLPHKSILERDSHHDLALCEAALAKVNMLSFAERMFGSLSGGEKQRVLIARAIAQECQFWLLDEPTNHLDVRYQFELMDLIKTLGKTTLAALHDLNLAAYYCDHLVMLKAGQVYAEGAPETLLQPKLIEEVYGIASDVVQHPVTAKPSITFLPPSLQKEATRQDASKSRDSLASQDNLEAQEQQGQHKQAIS